MKKILKWIKDHIRPHCKYNRPLRTNKENAEYDRLEDLKENSDIGIKIKFKF